jgi:[acyl-carrier-protein] S-malonyltransferase
MRPAAEKLRERLAQTTFSIPKIAVINNVDVAAVSDPDEIRDALYRQAYNPVRWVETIEYIASKAIEVIVECGPGKVLSGLVKRINPNITGMAMFDPTTLGDVRKVLL